MSDQQVALISGGASGVGRRIAERFLEQGTRVHICDASADSIAETMPLHEIARANEVIENDSIRGAVVPTLD